MNLNRLAGFSWRPNWPDGSWKQARDPALPSGDINATVLNYAALKFFRTSISIANVQPAMDAARKFILAAGGIDSTNQFTKTFLALFGLRGWEEISEIPYLIFLEALPLNYRQVFAMGHPPLDPHGLPAPQSRVAQDPRHLRPGAGLERTLCRALPWQAEPGRNRTLRLV